MKNESKAQVSKTATPSTPKLDMDPIAVAKRKLDEARADYKRIKGIHEEQKGPKQDNSVRAGLKNEMEGLRAAKKATIIAIREHRQGIIDQQLLAKKIVIDKRAIEAKLKTAPRSSAKNEDVKKAQVELLKAELAYREACLG